MELMLWQLERDWRIADTCRGSTNNKSGLGNLAPNPDVFTVQPCEETLHPIETLRRNVSIGRTR